MKYTVRTIAGAPNMLVVAAEHLVRGLRRALADSRADYQQRYPLAKLSIVDISHRPDDGTDCAVVAGALGRCLVEPQAVEDIDLALLAALRRVVPGLMPDATGVLLATMLPAPEQGAPGPPPPRPVGSWSPGWYGWDQGSSDHAAWGPFDTPVGARTHPALDAPDDADIAVFHIDAAGDQHHPRLGPLDALFCMIDPERPDPDPLGVVRVAAEYARAADVEQGAIVLAVGAEPEAQLERNAARHRIAEEVDDWDRTHGDTEAFGGTDEGSHCMAQAKSEDL